MDLLARVFAERLSAILLISIIGLRAAADVQITKEPEPKEVNLGEPVTFSVEAFAPPAETILYQWYFNGQVISGATSPSLSIQNVQRKDLGRYWVKVGNLSSTKAQRKAETWH